MRNLKQNRVNDILLKKMGNFHVVLVRFGSLYHLGDNIRIKNICQLLIQSGFQVSSIPLPQVNRAHVFSGEGFKNILLHSFPPRNSEILSRQFSFKDLTSHFDYSVSVNYLLKAFRKFKPDLVLAETSQAGWLASIAARKLSIPCVVDVHGLAFAEALGEGNRDWKQILEIEKETFLNCNYIVAVSHKMKEYLSIQLNVPTEKIIVASNGSTPYQGITAKYKKQLSVIYAGIFSYWEKVNDFIDLAKICATDKFKFYLAGDGPLKSELLKRIRDEKIPVAFLGRIPRTEINDLLARMQVGIAPSTKDLARQVASPIKIFDYMACGLPVITPEVGDWGNLITTEDCGIALEDDSIVSYRNALEVLSRCKIWEAKSRNAINAINEKYSWNKTLEPIVDLVSEIASKS